MEDNRKMENSYITLPTLLNGVITLGDLWDCRSSTMQGTLFDKPLQTLHLLSNSMQTQSYTLERVKDAKDFTGNMKISVELELECAGGKVKIKGKAGFERIDEKKFDQESIICDFDVKTHQVTLREAATATGDGEEVVISKKVWELIKNGKIPATHYVESVILGGQAHAKITYFENMAKDHMDLFGSLEGTIALGPVTATAKASLQLLDSNYSKTHTTEITVSAQPCLDSAPTNCKKMFKEVEKLDAVLAAEKHFPQLDYEDENGVKMQLSGIPVSFLLAPVNRLFVPGSRSEPDTAPTYPILDPDVLATYASMISTLHDFGSIEMWKGLAREEAPTTMVILKDEAHPITKAINNLALDVGRQADAFKAEALQLFDSIKYGEVENPELAMVGLIARFETELNPDQIRARVVELARRGRSEMAAIRSTDIVNLVDEEGRPAVEFFTNASSLINWYTKDQGIQVLLLPVELSQASGREGKVFVTLYQMAGELRKFGVSFGLPFPSVKKQAWPGSSEEPEVIELRVKTPPHFTEQSFFEEDEIVGVLHLLKLAFGLPAPKMMQTFVALQTEIDSIPLLLRNQGDLPVFLDIYLPPTPADGLVIVETLCDLLALLTSAEEHELGFVFPLEDKSRGLDFFQALYDWRPLMSLASGGRSKWYFSKINVTSVSAPLCFVFRGNVLLSICNDALDLAILCNALTSSEDEGLALLSPENTKNFTIYVDEWNFACQFIPNAVTNHDKSLGEVIPYLEPFPPHPKYAEWVEGMVIVGEMATGSAPSVFNKLARTAIVQTGKELETALKKNIPQWKDEGIEGFKGVEWAGLVGDLKTLINSTLPELMQIQLVIKELDGLYEKPEEPEEPEVPEEPEDQNELLQDRIDEIISFITDSTVGSPFFALKPIVASISREDDNYKNWLARKNAIVDILHVFLLQGIGSQEEELFYVHRLTDFAEGMSQTVPHISEIFHTVGMPYLTKCCSTEPSALETQITDSFLASGFGSCVSSIRKLTVHPKLRRIQAHLSQIRSNLEDPVKTKQILRELLDFEFLQLEVVWRYPKFLYLIRANIANLGVQLTAFELLSPHAVQISEGIYYFPDFVPRDISSVLEPLFNQEMRSGTDFPWIREWLNMEDFIKTLQLFMAWAQVPDEFQGVLHSHIVTEGGFLRLDLQAKGCLYYFNADREIFDHGWTLETVENVLDAFQIDGKKPFEKMIKPEFNKFELSQATLGRSVPESILVNEDWLPFTPNGRVTLPMALSIFTLTSRGHPPTLGYNQREEACSQFLQYFSTPLNSAIPDKLTSSRIPSLINYPNSELPNQINFKNNSNPGSVFTRDAFINLAMQTRDPSFSHYFLQQLVTATKSLPLLVPDISQNPETKSIWLLPLLEEVNFVDPRLELRFTFNSVPHRFVLTVRVGNAFPEEGKSSLLNKLILQDPTTFGSLSGYNPSLGRPLGRTGTLEFVQLTAQTTQIFFTAEMEAMAITDPVFLGVLHGSGLELEGEEWSRIAKCVSSVVVFYAAKDWDQLSRLREELMNGLGGSGDKKFYNLVLYPDPVLGNKVGADSCIFLSDPDSIKATKLSKILLEAIEFNSDLEPELSSPPATLLTIAPTLSTLESLNFLEIFTGNKIQDVKYALKTFLDTGVVTPLGARIASTFLLLLKGTSSILQSCYHVHLTLDALCSQACLEYTRKLFVLRANYDPSSKGEVQFLRSSREDRTLFLSDILHFVGCYTLAKGNPEDLVFFIEALNLLLAEGFALQLDELLEDGEPFYSLLEAALSLPPFQDKKITSVGLVGGKGSGKSIMANELFGRDMFGAWSCTRGIWLRLVPLQKFSLDADFLLVLDSEGIAAPENEGDSAAQQRETKILAFMMTRAELLLVHGNKDDGETTRFLRNFQGALLQIVTTDGNEGSIPNLVLSHGAFDSGAFASSVKGIGRLLDGWRDELHSAVKWENCCNLGGVVGAALIDRLSTPEIIEDQSDPDPLLFKTRRLVQRCLLETRRLHKTQPNLSTWLQTSRTAWNPTPTPPNPQIDKILASIQSGTDALDSQVDRAFKLKNIRVQIAKAFSTHQDELLYDYLTDLDHLFGQEEGTPVDDNEIDQLLKEIKANLFLAVYDCQSCSECSKAFVAMESFFREIEAIPDSFQIKERLDHHITSVRFGTFQLFTQFLLGKRLKTRRSGAWKALISQWTADGLNSEQIFTAFTQQLSNLQGFKSWEQAFLQEIGQVPEEDLRLNFETIPLISNFMTRFYSESAIRRSKGWPRDLVKLTWRDEFWLKGKIDGLPALIFAESGDTVYQWGMGVGLMEQLNMIMEGLGERLHVLREDLHPELVQMVKDLGVGTFRKWITEREIKFREEWDAVWLLEGNKFAFLENPVDYFQD